MANIVSILLLLSLRDAVASYEYSVSKEGDDVILSFNITLEAYWILKNNWFLLKVGRRYTVILNSRYKERIRYDKTQRTSGGRFSFTFLNVSSSDAGFFECISWRRSERGCSQLLVIAREPTKPEVGCDSDLPVEGHHVTLTCYSSSRSLPQDHPLVMKYRWRKNGKDFESKQADAAKIILTLSTDDRGDTYSCQAFEETPPSNPPSYISYEGGLDSPWSSAFILQPLFPPEISLQTMGEGIRTTHEGEPLSFTGVISSNPEATVTLTSPNGTSVLMTSEETNDSTYKISYTIGSATCDDHGIFNVTAVNLFGSDHSSVAVAVLCSPRLDSKPKSVPSSNKNSLSFTIQAFPKPTLEAICSFSPGGSIKAISPIQAEQEIHDGLMIQSNLHEFIVDFPCEASDGKYLLTFVNSEGKKNISFSLGDNLCKAKKRTSLTGAIEIDISIALFVLALVVILYVIIRKLVHRSKQRRRRNRRVIYIPRSKLFNHNRNTEVNLDISP